MALTYESVSIGDELPPLVLPPLTREQLALYADASNDRNPIHVDVESARAACLTSSRTGCCRWRGSGGS